MGSPCACLVGQCSAQRDNTKINANITPQKTHTHTHDSRGDTFMVSLFPFYSLIICFASATTTRRALLVSEYLLSNLIVIRKNSSFKKKYTNNQTKKATKSKIKKEIYQLLTESGVNISYMMCEYVSIYICMHLFFNDNVAHLLNTCTLHRGLYAYA